MDLLQIILIGLVAFVFSVLYRRYQIKAAKTTRVDGLGAVVLEMGSAQANRQQLADILKDWDALSLGRAAELKQHLSAHPRLDGVDLSDDAERRAAYEALVGISPGKSPEK